MYITRKAHSIRSRTMIGSCYPAYFLRRHNIFTFEKNIERHYLDALYYSRKKGKYGQIKYFLENSHARVVKKELR